MLGVAGVQVQNTLGSVPGMERRMISYDTCPQMLTYDMIADGNRRISQFLNLLLLKFIHIKYLHVSPRSIQFITFLTF